MKAPSQMYVLVTCALIAGLSTATARAETPEELVKRMQKKSDEYKSVYMNQKSTTKSQFMEMETTTKSWYLYQGDTYKFRTETEGTMKYAGSAESQKMSSLSVCDGKIMWIESKQMGMTQVTKQNAPKRVGESEAILESIKNGVATVKPSETVNGYKCAVLEIVYGQGDQATTTTHWISEKYGSYMKTVISGKIAGETVVTTTEFKADVKIDDSKLTYSPPAGANVQDMTK